ncbi:MAG: HD domain-containing protein [Candidatus Paceibacterota bacterium]|jgi:(p)ppGpp synthase/HD superfamily hydrolase
MIHTQKIKDAIRFSIDVHEIVQKQKRKGKDIPYITHPLTVGLILASAGAGEDLIVAGILHDTVEDSPLEKKVTKEKLELAFGENVAELVVSVTEKDRALSWDEIKRKDIEHIKTLSRESLLLKSADVVANTSELLDDYEREGEATFARFHVPKEKFLKMYINVMKEILKYSVKNPLKEDVKELLAHIRKLNR